MPNSFIIDFEKLEVYEAGALFLTLFAYPEKNISEHQLENIHASLCAWELRLRYNKEPDWKNTPQLIKPLYAFRDDKQIVKDLKAFPRRLKERAVAGRMAMAYVKEGFSGKELELPKGVRRLSLNEISLMVLKDSGESDPENLEKRTWRKSLPVIHLCAATQYIMQILDRAGTPVSDFTDLLHERPLVEAIIQTAQEFQSLLIKSRLKIDPKNLMDMRLAP